MENKQLEKAFIELLNFDGWDIKWSEKVSFGTTPKGQNCVISLFRQKRYNRTKTINADVIEALNRHLEPTVKVLVVIDKKASWFYWLNKISVTNYKLEEYQAHRIWLNK